MRQYRATEAVSQVLAAVGTFAAPVNVPLFNAEKQLGPGFIEVECRDGYAIVEFTENVNGVARSIRERLGAAGSKCLFRVEDDGGNVSIVFAAVYATETVNRYTGLQTTATAAPIIQARFYRRLPPPTRSSICIFGTNYDAAAISIGATSDPVSPPGYAREAICSFDQSAVAEVRGVSGTISYITLAGPTRIPLHPWQRIQIQNVGVAAMNGQISWREGV